MQHSPTIAHAPRIKAARERVARRFGSCVSALLATIVCAAFAHAQQATGPGGTVSALVPLPPTEEAASTRATPATGTTLQVAQRGDVLDGGQVGSSEANAPAANVVEQRFDLKRLTAQTFHDRLETALGRKLPIQREDGSPWLRFAIESENDAPVMATAHVETGELRLLGRPSQLNAWRTVVSALDAPPEANRETRMVAANRTAGPHVRQAVTTLLAQGTQTASGAGERADGGETVPDVVANENSLLGPVQVEFVEGTDLLILQGNPRDIEVVERIIHEIEAITQTSPPTIDIHALKHVDSTAMSRLLDQVFSTTNTASLAPVYGRPLALPLIRPNSVLLIGPPSTVEKAKELLDKLDVTSDENWQFRVFRLNKAVAEDAEGVLEDLFVAEDEDEAPVFRPRALIIADSRSNALIVRAGPSDMEEIARLIAELDRTAATQGLLKVFPVENGDAAALVEMLETLFVTDQGNNQQSVAPLRFSVDERTNSVLAFGNSEDLVVVEAILLRLDTTDSRQRKNYVYQLRNANAEDVATALQQALEAERDVQQTAPGTASPFQQIEREVVVVPELASNSLIVSATPRAYKDIVKVIEDLDQQVPMVMIQVLIGEVRLGDADEFGVEMGLQDSVLFDRSLLSELSLTSSQTTIVQPGGGQTIVQQDVVQGANLSPGYNWSDPTIGLGNSGSDLSRSTSGQVAAQALSSFALQRLNPDLGFGGLVLSASSDSVSMLLRALQESRRLEILSRPQIMALDGQLGTAFVGERVPIIRNSNITQFGTQNTVDLERVGLLLNVEPRISPDGLVVMHVQAEKSELGRVADGVPVAISQAGVPINQPRIAQTFADTVVSAVSGQTIVLSGLLTKRDFSLHRRVPLLADIPLIGDMFRYDTTSVERTELLIILTPHVVRTRYEAEMLKQVESARMSWCLSDVVDLHGPAGLRSRDDVLGEAEAETVYPEPAPMSGDLVLPAPVEAGMMPKSRR
ncbi:MAG: hypothetical protein KDA61_11480 [Planctomycetales bacterium]|nr:hypothetical protein [Planctomycetales bacterium]